MRLRIIAAGGACLALPLLASPAIDTINVQDGSGSSVVWSITDATGCLTTTLDLEPGSETINQPPSQPRPISVSSAFLRMDQVDACTGESHEFIGFTSPADYSFDRDLVATSIVTALLMCDTAAPESCFGVDVDVTFTGVYDVGHIKSTLRIPLGDGAFFLQHMNGYARVAVASGSVSDGTTNYLPGPVEGATIFVSDFHQVTHF
jgi:hypothetical protein